MPRPESQPSRELIGYKNTPPQAGWSNNARVEVNFCINYEEDAEMCILNGDSHSECGAPHSLSCTATEISRITVVVNQILISVFLEI
jgi:hypothetical protein